MYGRKLFGCSGVVLLVLCCVEFGCNVCLMVRLMWFVSYPLLVSTVLSVSSSVRLLFMSVSRMDRRTKDFTTEFNWAGWWCE